MAARRLQKEYSELTAAPIPGIFLSDNQDIYKWQVTVEGPEDSPYHGGFFFLEITFSPQYPMKPPCVVFSTRIFHPNISSANGATCIMTDEEWEGSYTTRLLLEAIYQLLEEPRTKDWVMDHDAAYWYDSNRRKFEDKACEWTRKYAM